MKICSMCWGSRKILKIKGLKVECPTCRGLGFLGELEVEAFKKKISEKPKEVVDSNSKSKSKKLDKSEVIEDSSKAQSPEITNLINSLRGKKDGN